jgi:polygalacturonase
LIHRITLLLILLAGPRVATRPVSAQTYNITNFGARGDGKTINTGAIQRAIEACAKTGGTVWCRVARF